MNILKRRVASMLIVVLLFTSVFYIFGGDNDSGSGAAGGYGTLSGTAGSSIRSVGVVTGYWK